MLESRHQPVDRRHAADRLCAGEPGAAARRGAHRRLLHPARQRGLRRRAGPDDRLRHRRRGLRHPRADHLRLPEPARFAAVRRALAAARTRRHEHQYVGAAGLQPALLELHLRRRRVRLRPGLQHHRSGSQRHDQRVRRPGPLPAGTRRRLGSLPDGDDDLLRPAAPSVLYLAAAAGGGDRGGRADPGRLPRRTQVRQSRGA